MKIRISLISLLVFSQLVLLAQSAPCDIRGGRSELILDVVESIGEAFDQPIEPDVLPIEGEPGADIELELSEKGQMRFSLRGKTLNLTKPLDRDENSLSTLRFEISCLARSSMQTRTIPVVLRIRDVNDNAPEFKAAPYHVAVGEDAIVNSPIFNGIQASDRDSGRNGQVEYQVVDISPNSGQDENIFSIRFPHQGAVFLMAPLDYERTPLYRVTVMATDYSENLEDRLNATTTLTVRVQDVDDRDPEFESAQPPANCTHSEEMFSRCLPEYFSSVVEGQVAGVLDVYPGRIHADDVDTIGASVTYSFKSGTPTSFEKYFTLDSRTAAVTQIKPVDRTQIKRFDIVIQAMENSARRGRASARLLINVEKVDTSPPKLVIPAYTGKVLEASIPGTPVLRDDGSEGIFVLSVFDPDIEVGEDTPQYVFELTTSAFEVNDEGVLVVATPNLDRDPPNLSEHTFQAIAREEREGGSASAPVTLTVRLLDINDNPPRLPILPTVTVPAGALKRSVIEVKATDLDEGANAMVTYDLVTGSRDKFTIDSQTGLITAVGNLEAGEKFFLNVKATDRGNLSSEGFVEVVISKGPNTNGPIFTRAQYSATIPEDIPHGEEILSVQAKDPEDEISYYSIADGNEGEVFEMDTLTGILSVVAPLDRETHDQYTLTIRAEDSEGKSNTATALIKVTDVNDEAPSFVGEPFSFRVDEGASNASVGVIKSKDRDLGRFGEVGYLLEGTQHLFRIDSKTGHIFTNASLDYEKEQVHYVSVVAHDMADDPRSASTTVTVLVNDLTDEKPLFPKTTYKVQVLENTAIGSVVATVVAEDKDTVKSITYKMLEGNPLLFKVAPDTGRLTVAGPLDYEEASSHRLTIGTEENDEDAAQARTTVLVEVEDMNDNTPEIDPIHTVTLAKEAPLNTLLMNVSASDADGTSPNNQISLAFMENGDVASYFKINKGNGEIRLKKLLTDANFTELTVKISATDGGEPALSTSTEFRVLLLEGTVETFGDSPVGTLGSSPGGGAQLSALASSPRFSKERFELEVRENLPVGSEILKVPMVNTTTSAITCSFAKGNEEGSFRTMVTQEGNCEIISARELDYEEKPSYDLSIVLRPEGFDPGQDQQIPTLSEAIVRISILDLNDNSPAFALHDLDVLEDQPELTILSFALQNSPIDTNIIQLEAKDLDSGRQGAVEYELLPETNRGNYFGVNSKTGRIFTKRKLFNVPLELQPFNLSLVAKDEPEHNQTQQATTINVIIPIIEESQRAVLFLDVPKSETTRELIRVKKSIAEATGKIVQIESVKHGLGSSLQESQLWFHLLEPHSWQPANLENLYEEKKNANFLKNISTSVEGISALKLLSPAQVMQSRVENRKKTSKDIEEEGQRGGVTKVNTATGLTSLEYALIALAALIILFVLFSIVLVCVLWSRFSKKWNSADKTVMLIPPIIERPASVLESVSKEYEVQVLHMSVPLDDDSVQEMTMEPESPRQLYLDNVSYISKSRNGLEGSSSGGSSGVATPSALVMDQSGGSFGAWSPDTPAKGAHFSSTQLEGDFSASATNENVMFVRRGFGGPSPVETTTEL